MSSRLDPLHALRFRIGVDLGHTTDGDVTARAVGLRGARIAWQVERALPAAEPLRDALATFLTGLPATSRRRIWLSRRVAVALGPSFVQHKRLPGLPPLADPRELSAAVRANAARFFLRNGVPIVTSVLRIDGPGDAWAAAAEQPLLSDIESACRSAGLRLVTIVPTGAILDRVAAGHLPDLPSSLRTISWSDAGRRYYYSYTGRRLVHIRRALHIESADPADTHPIPSIPPGPAGIGFAGAYGAAIAWRDEPVAWQPTHDASLPANRRARATAWTALALALVMALAAPGLSATLSAHSAAAHARADAPRRRAALAAADSLARATAAIAQVDAFAAARRPVTLSLGELTRVLPTGTALTALQIDTAGGSLIALTPKTAPLISALAADPSLGSIQVIGPVTHESVPGQATSGGPPAPSRELERVAVRFRFAGAPPR